MAGSLNKASILGNVGKDPEIRSTQDGRRIAQFSLATSESWKDKNSGERKEVTEWHRIVVFNEHLIPVIEKYVHKGSKLYIEGAIKTRKWTDQAGVEKYSTEIVLSAFNGTLILAGDGPGGDRQGGDRPAAAAPRERAAPARAAAPPRSAGPSWDPPKGGIDDSDEIPF